jgi:tetratricopeptide (TPR) repeat protein
MILSICSLSAGEGYLGAEELLGKIEREVDAGKSGEDPADAVRAGLRNLVAKPQGLPDKEAAAAWVSLIGKYLAIPEGKRSSLAYERPPLTLENLFEGLPRPEAWKEIPAAIEELPESDPLLRESLLLIEATLSGDSESHLAALGKLKQSYLARKQGDSWSERNAEQYFGQAERAVKARAGDPLDAVGVFRKALESAEKGGEPENEFLGSSSISVPALAGTVPEKEAEDLILRAIKTGQVYGIEGGATKRLVAKVMMAHPDAVTKPLWEVVETPAEIPLFEILDGQSKEKDDWQFNNAEGNYIKALLELREYDKAHAYVARRAKEGSKVNFGFGAETFSGDEKRVAEALGFFGKLLQEDPTFPYWHIYRDLAEQAGESAAALLAMKAAMDKAQEGTEQVETLRSMILGALLSGGSVEEGIAFLREVIVKMSENGAVSNERQVEALLGHSLRLARLGRLLGKPDVVEEAFAAAEKAVILSRKYSDSGHGKTFELVGELVKQGRGAKAEELLADELVSATRLTGNSRRPRGDIMTALAYVYSDAGRHADVVALLEKGTMWDADDLSDLRQSSFQGKPLMLIAAKALHAEGRDDNALQLLDRVFERESDNDDAYMLLLEIGGKGVIGKLDRIHAENRFEERPLIWKAKALCDAGELDEAEKTAKAAIAIDPSDGDQGKGDRMRIYAVLGDIMAKKGDNEQAEFLERVVKAIRMSEKGDDWWYAGIQKRAISIYEESLNEFADAYCIQSRLALRYAEMGDFANAQEHYRRAFELMPESFGRVESHCFGCEGAFSGELAQGIAEAVFMKLAKEMPDRAQVFYLLGYLREEQGRAAEAAEHFAKAVEIDPDYINAWSKLDQVADEAGLNVEMRDRISLAMFRLNPYRANLGKVSDLAKLWSTALEADKGFAPEQTGPVFTLRASKRIPEHESSNYYSSYGQKISPRTQVISHERVSETVSLLESLWRN